MMNVLVNHCWCSKSHRAGEHYDCSVIVSIERIAKDKTYYDPPTEDWTNLIDEHLIPDGRGYDKRTNRLKPEVMEWLDKNIADCYKTYGWAVGSDDYNSTSTLTFCVFFQRQIDAMKFIKTWSVFGKPVDYLNYFKDIRKTLDFKTNRLKRIDKK